jgi:hypothetical protein
MHGVPEWFMFTLDLLSHPAFGVALAVAGFSLVAWVVLAITRKLRAKK